MRKVVFFDRDGVINNNEDYYIYQWEKFRFNEGVIEGLKKLAQHGYEFIIISNQSGVFKNIYSIWDVEVLHNRLSEYLFDHGISILEYYYCVHHPETTNCLCRKPQSLLFEKAIARFNIDVQHSWMIGDQMRDIEAAKLCGIRGILVEPNSNLLLSAVNKIIYE
ncbi:MAG: HAD family hydrolase [Bacteroidales bacterium]|nr:HAD family hydrolase [Bacteroidales bacterium]